MIDQNDTRIIHSQTVTILIYTNNKHNVKNEFGILQLEIKDDDIQKQRRTRSKKYLPDYRLYPFNIGKMIFLQDEQKIDSLFNSEKNSS